MAKTDIKQMRVSKTQHDVLASLSDRLGISRAEVLNNAVALTKFLIDNKAVAVKAICKDGSEKELFLSILLGTEE